MNLTKLKYKANYYVLLLLAFVIPLERKFAPPLIILLLLTSLINNRFKELKGRKVLLFAGLYLLYVVGVFYSLNKAVAYNNLVEKLSLIVFPLIMYIMNINLKEKLNNVLYSFIDGVVISAVISVIISVIKYYFLLDTSMFFYGNSSSFLHPSYYAMYACFALLISYVFIFNQARGKGLIKPMLLILFLSITILFSASKTGLIAMLIIHFSATVFWVVKSKKYIQGLIVVLFIFASLLMMYRSSSFLKYRVNELIKVTTSGNTSGGSTTAARIDIWKLSIDLVKEKPILGYGTGDVKDVLIKTYIEKGYDDFAKKKLNTHNQFLQTSIALGLVGGVYLLLMLIIPLFFSVQQKSYLYTFFILLIILNFLTESMLERQAGIVFYCFFNTLFFMVYLDNNNTKNRLLG